MDKKILIVDDEQLICYSQRTEDFTNIILVVVNLDCRNRQSGWVDISQEELGLNPGQSYIVDDRLNEARYTWRGQRNYVELNPQKTPAHIFRVNRPG